MANTQMERCPRCESGYKHVFKVDPRRGKTCIKNVDFDPWHSTPAAPDTAPDEIVPADEECDCAKGTFCIVHGETLRKEEAPDNSKLAR